MAHMLRAPIIISSFEKICEACLIQRLEIPNAAIVGNAGAPREKFVDIAEMIRARES